jgi:hypothetical protein
MTKLGANGSGGTLTCNTKPETAELVSVTAGCRICVKAATKNKADVLVNFAGIHQPDDFAVLEPGDNRYYRSAASVCLLTFKSDSGTQVLHVDSCGPS